MDEKNLNDEQFGTRDKRGHWKPFGSIPINPPYVIPFKPIKLFKYYFKYPGMMFPWTFIFILITIATYFFFYTLIRNNENIRDKLDSVYTF